MVYVVKYDEVNEKVAIYHAGGEGCRCAGNAETILELPLRREFVEDLAYGIEYLGGSVKRSGDEIEGRFEEVREGSATISGAKRIALYVMVLATLERYDKELARRALITISNLNPVFARIWFNIAVDRYRERKDDVDWVLRVGRAIRILYGLDNKG